MIRASNILVITSWSLQDGLIQAYTIPYLRMIKKHLPPDGKIILVTSEKNEVDAVACEIEPGIWNHPLRYTPFSAKAAVKWCKNIFILKSWMKKYRTDVIHVWCTPSGMIGYILSVLTGKKLIIDSYEPHAEAMVENGEWKKNSMAFKILFIFEKWQTRRATCLIAAAAGMRDYAKQKYHYSGDNFFVKPACVDLAKFNSGFSKNEALLDKYDLKNKIVGLYSGKFGGIYLDREVFDFFKVAFDYWKEDFRILLLTSEERKNIESWAAKAGLDAGIIISEFVAHDKIAEYIGLADFAITPVKPVPTKKYCTPVKDGEYWAMGLPVVITKGISDDSEIIEENSIGGIIEPGNILSYRNAVMEIDKILKENPTKARFDKIHGIAVKYRNFSIAEKIYRSIYGK